MGAAISAALLATMVVVAAPAAAAPGSSVLFVVDNSGSMSGAPLQQAKEALHEGIGALSSGQAAGLRSFEGDCSSSGQLLVPVGTNNRQALTSATNGLGTGGGTPTPQALRAAAADLPATGDRTIVLISDGQSTCGDPCAAAQELKNQYGIDFRIHSVGFNAPDQAETELSCIARVSGGKYVTATNKDELANAVKSAVESSNPQPTGASCTNPDKGGSELADIIYIGVRGSGQTTGMGAQAWSYYRDSLRPAAERAKRTTTYVELGYSSASVLALLPNPAIYKGSYDTGLELLRSKVRLIANELLWASEKGANCRNAKIVFGGYSQGALIVHRFLQDPTWLENPGTRFGLGPHWGGAILFADPDQFPGDGLQKSPVNVRSKGIAQSFPGTGATRAKVTGKYASNSYSVCVLADLVCDFGTTALVSRNPIAGAAAISAGAAIHTTAYTSQVLPPYYGWAAADLTRKVVGSSKPA
ncbi:hypothetical protein nbrc107696_04340 [Gordonia spumicola]|uniref:VWFA domain-containing protein n=1 Tax=Gordonia spumicola TaxID=589161 RepID=A0A7I9V3I5_9ACTN|nr:VWA domain-containing protein [Gordonia spumicola]GED99987.1 hypothetical protein nbrc107696_04340 [Gordonia spumicola]